MASTKGASARGRRREKELQKRLEAQGYFVVKAGGSLGDADLVVMKAGEKPRLVEVKSTAAGPFHSFGPQERLDLKEAAKRAGAEPFLCFWPPRKEPKWIGWTSWPDSPLESSW